MGGETHSASRAPHAAFTAKIPKQIWFQAAALLIACVAAWPLLSQPGLLNTRGGGDSPFLLQRLHQLVVALDDGHFPVRWMPDANYGYGYPFFNYYAPLSIYVAAAFRFLGFGFVRAIQLAQLAGFLLAAWGAFHLARRWFRSAWAGLLASVAYTVAPFHMVNVYVRGDSLAEFWAMALYPMVLLAVDGVADGGWRAAGGRWRVVGLALVYAALVLCHNISALIFTPFLLLYILLRWTRHRPPTNNPSPITNNQSLLLLPLAGLALGLALSAWFWLPALAETSLAQTEPVTAGYFHYSTHFWGWDLVQGRLLFDYDVSGRGAFRMGLLQTLFIAAGLVTLLWHWRRRSSGHPHTPTSPHPYTPHLYIATTFVIATVMITPLSRPVWDNLPLLPFTQFPWRFLSVQALAGALAIGALALLPWGRWGRRILVPAGVALLLVTALGDLHTDHLPLADADVTPERLAQYEWFTGNIGSTVSAEYLPHTVQTRPYTSPWVATGARNRVQVLDGRAVAELVARHATRQTWQVTATGDVALVVFPTLYWPGWGAQVDGEPAPAAAASGSGLMMVIVPAGEHIVTLSLGKTFVRLAAEIISVLALVVGGGYWLLVIGDWRLRALNLQSLISNLAPVLVILLLAAIAVWARPVPPPAPGTLTWDFAQMGYLHHAPAGIPFADGSVLHHYEYSADTVEAGDEITVTLHWSPSPSASLALSLATPAVHRVPHAPLLVTETQPPGDVVTFTLAIPENAPAGLIVPRLQMGNLRALTPSGQPRGDLFLRPLRIENGGGGASATAPADAPLGVRVTEALVTGEMPTQAEATGLFDCAAGRPSPGALELHLAWATQQPLTDNFQVSLRLTDGTGVEVAQCDSQPGYGFQPSSSWIPGRWMNDWLALPLPPQLPPSGPYAVLARLYDPAGEVALTRRLGELAWRDGALAFRRTQPSFTVPEDVTPLEATFGDAIRLRGYTLERRDETLLLTLYWEALANGQVDYTRFVHLLDPAGGRPVAQADGMPRNNSYPTGQWTAGEVVADPVVIEIGDVPAGEYAIATGFYLNEGDLPRLPATDAQGRSLPENRILLPETITLP